MTELEQIQKDGANSRALGSTLLDNPYYAEKNMPYKTGELQEVRQEKIAAWELGWRAEDLLR